MRTSRLISLLLHLQVRGVVTGAELASLTEVSERTLQRDIATLIGVGIPITSTRGPGGGYRIEDGYRGRLVGLDPDEAATLALLGMPGVASALDLG